MSCFSDSDRWLRTNAEIGLISCIGEAEVISCLVSDPNRDFKPAGNNSGTINGFAIFRLARVFEGNSRAKARGEVRE